MKFITILITLIFNLGLYAQNDSSGPPMIDSYDLRGRGFSVSQVREAAQKHSEKKLVLVSHSDVENTLYQDLILRLIGENMLENRKRIMVLFVDRIGDTATYIFAKGELRDGVIGDGSDYGVTLNKTIEEMYDLYFN